jgi:glycosyltransferase involved in cell wall biosynthesis
MVRKKILIEGWRGINHSYAMVNQNQILELIQSDHDLQHHDLPFYRTEWNSINNDAGFNFDDKSKIFSLKTGEPSQPYDIIYRISFPYRLYQCSSKKLFVFGTAEFQNIDGFIYDDKLDEGINNPNLKIITPSNWSKIGFLRAGFQESQVCVIPHGINPQVYKPISFQRRKQFRDALKVSDDDFLLLSLGAMTQNKGVDLLILAYSILKEKYPHLKLVLKDSSNLYGLRAADVFRNHYQKSNEVSESIFGSNGLCYFRS